MYQSQIERGAPHGVVQVGTAAGHAWYAKRRGTMFRLERAADYSSDVYWVREDGRDSAINVIAKDDAAPISPSEAGPQEAAVREAIVEDLAQLDAQTLSRIAAAVGDELSRLEAEIARELVCRRSVAVRAALDRVQRAFAPLRDIRDEGEAEWARGEVFRRAAAIAADAGSQQLEQDTWIMDIINFAEGPKQTARFQHFAVCGEETTDVVCASSRDEAFHFAQACLGVPHALAARIRPAAAEDCELLQCGIPPVATTPRVIAEQPFLLLVRTANPDDTREWTAGAFGTRSDAYRHFGLVERSGDLTQNLEAGLPTSRVRVFGSLQSSRAHLARARLEAHDRDLAERALGVALLRSRLSERQLARLGRNDVTEPLFMNCRINRAESGLAEATQRSVDDVSNGTLLEGLARGKAWPPGAWVPLLVDVHGLVFGVRSNRFGVFEGDRLLYSDHRAADVFAVARAYHYGQRLDTGARGAPGTYRLQLAAGN